MDHIFEVCESWLKNATDSTGISLEKLYEACDPQQESQDPREVVIRRVISNLLEIQRLSVANPLPNGMIAISLQDMKIFNAMTNLFVIEGIYACLSPGVNVPLELRSKRKTTVTNHGQNDPGRYRNLLNDIVSAIEILVTTKGDVRDLLLRGTYTADFLCASIEFSFNPEYDRDPSRYERIKSELQTYDLYQYFTTLLRPESPGWFKALVSRQLAILPVARPNGVRALIEFISGLRTHEQISLTDLDKAVQVLKTVPKGIPQDKYSSQVGEQLITILGKTVVAAAALGSNSTSPADLLKTSTIHVIHALYEQDPSVIQNGLQKELVNRLTAPNSEKALSEGLGALASLVVGTSELVDKLCERLIVPLWSLLCYYSQTKRSMDQLKGLIIAFIQVQQADKGSAATDTIVKSLLVKGTGQYSFGAGPEGGVEIRAQDTEINDLDIFQAVDGRIELFKSLLKDLEDEVVSGVFVRVIRRWLTTKRDDDDTVINALIDVRILEIISQDYKDKLMKSPGEIIQVISSVLTEYCAKREASSSSATPSVKLNIGSSNQDGGGGDSDDEDEDEQDDENDQEIVSLCLSLIAGLAPELEGKDHELMLSLKPHVQDIIRSGSDRTSPLVSKALIALEFLTTAGDGGDGSELDKGLSKTMQLRKALAALEDPMVPIRAHGLHQIRTFIKEKDPVLDLNTGLQVLLAQLKDDDSFIYLNCIKALEELSDAYGPSKVVPALLEHYSHSEEQVDDRLKIGEVLLRIVQRLDEAFVGEISDSIVATLISMISVREGTNDERIRNSALSVLGAICEANPRGLSTTLMVDSVDCALGVLTFEKSNVMRSAAIVLIGSLVGGVDSLEQIPKEFVRQVVNRITAAQDDSDPLVRIQASTTMDRIREKRSVALGGES